MLRALFVQLATDVCLAVGAICANRTALAINTMSSCESGFSNKRPDFPPPPTFSPLLGCHATTARVRPFSEFIWAT